MFFIKQFIKTMKFDKRYNDLLKFIKMLKKRYKYFENIDL